MGGSGLLVSDRRGWNLGVLSALISAFPCSPAPGIPRCTPSLSPRRGRCRGSDQAGRASRLNVQSAQAPRTPRSRVAGSRAAGKRAASSGSVPAQAPHCPGETRVSPTTLGCGMPRPGSPVPSTPERREGLRASYWEGPSPLLLLPSTFSASGSLPMSQLFA